ncbi:MAG: FKBP-type peptidyl-prolyl cis-trans isomerase [Bacteroidota bacterium]
MNKIVFLISICILGISIQSCCTKKAVTTKSNDAPFVLKNRTDSVSYAIGLDIAQNMKKNSLEINSEPFFKGLDDAFKNNDSVFFTMDGKRQILTQWQQDMRKKMEDKKIKEVEENKKKSAEFLAQNKKNAGIIELPDGIQYKIIQAGNGTPPAAKDQVKVMYEGKLLDGTIFDSSYKRNQSATFSVSGLIKGWTELLLLMTPGSIWEAYIPAEMGYGDKGTPSIPGGSLLIFKIELIEVIPAK